MWYIGKSLKILALIPILFLCFVLVGCGSDENYENQFTLNIAGYDFVYNGNVELGKVALMTDDLDEIIDLYQEVGDDVGYRDSLLIAEKYNLGLGINAFVQNNLDTLYERGLTISNLEKIQIGLNKNSENAVLVNYEIDGGFINEIPVLYVSQLFIPTGNNIELASFISEDVSSRGGAINMFKKIQ